MLLKIEDRAKATGLNSTTFWLLGAAFVLTILHISDHVLRVDHSGWPFRPQVTPFTLSLLAFPMLLFALFGSRRLYWWRCAFLLIGTVATLYAHIAIETPHMQFAMWAYNRSADPRLHGFRNLPNIASPTLGILSVTAAMMLNVTAVLCSIAMFLNGRRLAKSGVIA